MHEHKELITMPLIFAQCRPKHSARPVKFDLESGNAPLAPNSHFVIVELARPYEPSVIAQFTWSERLNIGIHVARTLQQLSAPHSSFIYCLPNPHGWGIRYFFNRYSPNTFIPLLAFYIFISALFIVKQDMLCRLLSMLIIIFEITVVSFDNVKAMPIVTKWSVNGLMDWSEGI